MKNLKVTVFADPVCTWCWGSVPVLRALEFRLADKVEIKYVMGCMIDDIKKFSNRRLGIGGDIALSNRNMLKAWKDASAVHGMPVGDKGLRLFSEENRSTLPQNLAYIAATVYHHKDGGEGICPKRFLRRLQEATAVDAEPTGDACVIADIAAAVGCVPERFREIMESEEVMRLYEEDRALCRRYDVQTLPTYLVEYRGVEMMLRGFTSFETLMQNITEMSYGKITLTDEERFRPTAENVERFIERYATVYPVEIATAFSLPRKGGHSALNIESYEILPDIVEELAAARKISVKPRGNGFLLYPHKEKEPFVATVEDIAYSR